MEIKYLQVVVMENGEIICAGKTVGWKKDQGKYLRDAAIETMEKPIEIIVEGGVVQDVLNVPEGIEYVIKDLD